MSDGLGFSPDWTSPPGETIADILDERELSRELFAARLGTNSHEVQELIAGRKPITLEIAQKLEQVLGASAAFWMIRDAQFRIDLTRHSKESTNSPEEWLRELPTRDMARFGWMLANIGGANRVSACLDFFGVSDVESWRERYRGILETAAYKMSHSFDSKIGAVAAWLRQGEIQSEAIPCDRWDVRRFREELIKIRALTRKKDPASFLPELISRCAACGVAVVVVRTPAGCSASGATRFLSPHKALLVLSFRYLSDDHFWFTFFHEAGHLVLHGKRALFLEGDLATSTQEEEEANAFAVKVLIPPEQQATFLNLRAESREIISFARRIGIAPGIVVGQLQHGNRLRNNQFNGLKRRFHWAKVSIHGKP